MFYSTFLLFILSSHNKKRCKQVLHTSWILFFNIIVFEACFIWCFSNLHAIWIFVKQIFFLLFHPIFFSRETFSYLCKYCGTERKYHRAMCCYFGCSFFGGRMFVIIKFVCFSVKKYHNVPTERTKKKVNNCFWY